MNSLTDDPFTQLAREALSSYGASAVPATLQPASSVEPVLVQASLLRDTPATVMTVEPIGWEDGPVRSDQGSHSGSLELARQMNSEAGQQGSEDSLALARRDGTGCLGMVVGAEYMDEESDRVFNELVRQLSSIEGGQSSLVVRMGDIKDGQNVLGNQLENIEGGQNGIVGMLGDISRLLRKRSVAPEPAPHSPEPLVANVDRIKRTLDQLLSNADSHASASAGFGKSIRDFKSELSDKFTRLLGVSNASSENHRNQVHQLHIKVDSLLALYHTLNAKQNSIESTLAGIAGSLRSIEQTFRKNEERDRHTGMRIEAFRNILAQLVQSRQVPQVAPVLAQARPVPQVPQVPPVPVRLAPIAQPQPAAPVLAQPVRLAPIAHPQPAAPFAQPQPVVPVVQPARAELAQKLHARQGSLPGPAPTGQQEKPVSPVIAGFKSLFKREREEGPLPEAKAARVDGSGSKQPTVKDYEDIFAPK